jgi:hypothetical protein
MRNQRMKIDELRRTIRTWVTIYFPGKKMITCAESATLAEFIHLSTASQYHRSTNPGPEVLSSCSPRGKYNLPAPARAASPSKGFPMGKSPYNLLVIFIVPFLGTFWYI